MTEIEVTIRKNGEYMGAHYANNPDEIFLNVGKIWEWAAENSPKTASSDDIEEWFTKKLYAIFIQELACIFKGKDKLKIKGGACVPYCHHEALVDLMVTPDEWQEIRAFHRQKRSQYNEGLL